MPDTEKVLITRPLGITERQEPLAQETKPVIANLHVKKLLAVPRTPGEPETIEAFRSFSSWTRSG